MDETPPSPDEGDRRGDDRRKEAGAVHTGPERRVGDRRSGKDRRKSPRLYCPLPDDFE